MNALINADLYDYYDYRPDSYLLFDDTIREVGPMTEFPGAEESFDCCGTLVLPGLIIGHAHLYSAFFRGCALSPMNPRTFTELLKQFYWRIDGGLDISGTYHGARFFAIEHIKSGVTTLIDHHASGAAIRGSLDTLKKALCDEAGLRGIFCFETSDRFNVDECIEENLDFARRNSGPVSAGMFGAHASLSVSDETLKKISRVIGEIPFHVHTAESLEDQLQCINRYGKRIVERFNDLGLLNPASILAHCVNIDETEAKIMADTGCVAAINPTSNLNTSVGIVDYDLLSIYNIPVIIGNDSLGTNITRDYLNTVYSQRYRTKSAVGFGYDDLKACIRQVYRYASGALKIPLGRFRHGYGADMITVPYRSPTPITESSIFSILVDGVFNNFHPRELWCGGELRMKEFRTLLDEETIFCEAREESEKLWDRIGAK